MSKGFFGKLFDWNNDGKLDSFERTNEILWIEHMLKQESQKKEEEEAAARRAEEECIRSSRTIDRNAWRKKYGENIFNMSPEKYESESEYLRVLNHMYAWQKEWIDALSPEELNASVNYDVSPKDYPTDIAFHLELDQRIEDEVDRVRYMNIPVEEKKTFLQDSFAVLSYRYGPNRYTLYTLIEEMARLDYAEAVGMSKILLLNFQEALHKFGMLGSDIMSALERAVGCQKVFHTVVSDEVLKKSIFCESGEIANKTTQCIAFFALNGLAEIVDELLTLAYNNQYQNASFGEILSDVVMCCSSGSLPKKSVEIIMRWADKAANDEEKMKIKSILHSGE